MQKKKNKKKTNYTLFHKPLTKDYIPLKIPELIIGIKLKNEKDKILRYYDWWMHHMERSH